MFIEKRRNDLQIRYFIGKNESLEEFKFNEGEFKIIGISTSSDLISQNKSPFWSSEQYIAIEKSTHEKVQIYIYYYTDVISGEKVAILDAIRPDK